LKSSGIVSSHNSTWVSFLAGDKMAFENEIKKDLEEFKSLIDKL